MRRNPQWRYLINVSPDHLEAHDLDNEQMGASKCQISEIIAAGNARYLTIPPTETSLANWLTQNPQYDGCRYCLPDYHRK